VVNLTKLLCVHLRQYSWVGATMPTGAMPTTVIPTQFLSENNADNNNPYINIDSNDPEK
jgi:hypothetical protein